jgi:long-chain acyl-CoA synthetase
LADPAIPLASNLPEMLTRAAARYSNQTAFTTVMPNGMYDSLSFAQVDAMSDAFAAYLRGVLQVEPGARVALQVPNCLVTPIAAFGILKAGAVLVNTNPLYTAHEMQHQFSDSGAEVLVIADLFTDKLTEALPGSAIKKVLVCSVPSFFPPLIKQVVWGVMKYWNRLIPVCPVVHERFEAALQQGRSHMQSPSVKVADYWAGLTHDSLACLQYTGGTTGVSKGARLSHGNLLHNIRQILSVGGCQIDPGNEVVLTALPLYHIFAFTVNLLAFFQCGARNILVPSPRPIQNLQRAMENYRITWLSGVNTLYNALMSEEWFSAFPPRHIRAAIGGGAALNTSVIERWQKLTGSRLLEGYGLTEASPVVCFQPLEGKMKPGSIGLPMTDTEVRLLDDEGHTVAAGQPGELVLRGPQVMQGYWNRQEETRQVLKAGWLHTGDVAVQDEDGYFRIVDRKKDLILVSGFNVYPNEVEEILSRHPGVLECAVIGVPDEKTGEAVCACVVKAEVTVTDQELKDFCQAELTAYKLPQRFIFLDELPKSPIGKVLRKELRRSVVANGRA